MPPRASIALALVLLFSFRSAIHKQGLSIEPDYQVYYTAASLVRLHLSDHLYDTADSGLDPQMRLADTRTLYSQIATSMGLIPMMLFVYPPLLADAMVPLTLIPRQPVKLPPVIPSTLPSMVAWRIVNTAAIAATAWLLAAILALRRRGAVLLFFAIFFCCPVADCILFGQITAMLMLLLTASMRLYQRGAIPGSALLLSLAAAIKLTPLIVLLPFICWRDWRWVRWYGLGLAACVGLMCLLNGPAVLVTYALHVLPHMAGGIPNDGNKSFAASAQLAWLLGHGVSMAEVTRLRLADEPSLRAPAWIMVGARPIVLLVLAACTALLTFAGRLRSSAAPASLEDRLWIMAGFGALSVALAPVSWTHAYCLAVPLLVLSWRRTLDPQRPGRQPELLPLALLTLLSLETGSFIVEGVTKHLTHGPLLALMGVIVPATTVLWVLYGLLRMVRKPQLQPPAQPTLGEALAQA